MPTKRPDKPSLTSKICLRVTEEEKLALAILAMQANLSISELVRRKYLGIKITVNDNQNIIKELRRQGGLLKHIHNETGGAYSQTTAKAITEMSLYVERLRREK